MRADKMSRVLAWLALLAAVVLTAAGEYALYVGCGFGRWVSAAGPVCLDAYAVAAIRARREVLPAVLLMVGANATAHLLPADGPPVGVVVAVAALAPLVLWRTHVLIDDGHAEGPPRSGEPHLEVVVDDGPAFQMKHREGVHGDGRAYLEVAAAAGDDLRGAAEMVAFEDAPSSWDEPWRAPWDDEPDGTASVTEVVRSGVGGRTEASRQREALAAPVVAGWSSVVAQTVTTDDHLGDQADDHPGTFRDPGKMAAPVVAGEIFGDHRNAPVDDQLDDHSGDQGWAPVPTLDDQDAEVFRGSPENGLHTVEAPATVVQQTKVGDRNRGHAATVAEEGFGPGETPAADGYAPVHTPAPNRTAARGQDAGTGKITATEEGSGAVPTPGAEGAQSVRTPEDTGSTDPFPRADGSVATEVPVEPLSDADLRKAAKRLQRAAVRASGRPVTVEALRAELGVSRRRAAELRREVVGAGS